MWSRGSETGSERWASSGRGMRCLLGCIEFFQSAENSISAGVDAHRRNVGPADSSFAIDYKQCPLTKTMLLAVDAVLPGQLPLGLEVGKHSKVQLAVVRAGGMAPDAVDRDAQELCIVPLKFFQNLVVEGELIAADGAPVGRVECQDDGVAAKFGQRDLLIGRAVQVEGRRSSSRLKSALFVLLSDGSVNRLRGAMLFCGVAVRFVRIHVLVLQCSGHGGISVGAVLHFADKFT